MKIVLFLLNVGSFSSFHYSTKQGRDLVFQWNEDVQRHEVEIPYEQWKENNFQMAKDLLDQFLPVPVLFDVRFDEQPKEAEQPAEAPEVAPVIEPEPAPTPEPEPTPAETPEEPSPAKRARRKPSIVLNKALADLDDPLEKAALS